MMSTAPASNFSFLKSHDEQLVRLGQLAARYFPDDPNTCLLKLRQLAELLAQLTATRVGSYVSSDEKQFELLQRLERQGILTRDVGQLFAEVRRAGNDANHALRGDLRAALASLKITRQLGVWYYRTFANLRVPRHDGHDFGLMADSVPNGWRTISLQQRIAIRDAGLVSGMPLPGTVCPGARAIVTAHPPPLIQYPTGGSNSLPPINNRSDIQKFLFDELRRRLTAYRFGDQSGSRFGCVWQRILHKARYFHLQFGRTCQRRWPMPLTVNASSKR